MKTAVAHAIQGVRQVKTRYGLRAVAKIELLDAPAAEFWLSLKQAGKLTECFDALQAHGGYSSKHAECHIVYEEGERGRRFVWCGMHTSCESDLCWLEKTFDVHCVSPYVGRPDANPREPDERLLDAD